MKNKILSIILCTAMIFAYTTVYAEIPNVIMDSECNITVSGNLTANDIGKYVSVMLASDTDIGYVGQTKVENGGRWDITFPFYKNLANYRMKVNVAGEVIDARTFQALPKDVKLNLDLKLAVKQGIGDLACEIDNYLGIFTGENYSYTLLLASYDASGKMLSVNMSDNNKLSPLTQSSERVMDVIPDDAVMLKAFIWDFEAGGEPISGSLSKNIIPKNMPDTFNERESEWTPVNMRTASQKAAGYIGGEGGQRIQSIAISKDDSFLMCGNDTGGLNRSIDGGETWEDAYGGFTPGGASAIAIDPTNKNRVIAAGNPQSGAQTVSGLRSTTGLYLSEDMGYTWRQVLSQPGAVTTLDFREAICYDESTYDAGIGGCSTAYWSRPWRFQGNMGNPIADNAVVQSATDLKGLWKTTDGGETWENVNWDMADGVVKVHPTNGIVYVANIDGFHRSTDGGETFTTIKTGMILGVDVIDKPGYENYVWICDGTGCYLSTDCGATFTKINKSGFPSNVKNGDADGIVRYLKVSPVNPDNMVVASYSGAKYQSAKYYSTNGGSSWSRSSEDESLDFFKNNNRHPIFAWSNLAANKVWSIGGDWITLSENGGRTYKWHYNGGGDVFVDQRTIFNIYNPDIMYYGSQDFHGALTTDYGDTWKHIWKIDWKGGEDGHYAGYVYGSYAVDANTLVAIVRYYDTDGSQKREIRVSYDAGETWTRTGKFVTGRGTCKFSEMCMQSPTDPNVLFAGKYRSTDKGHTWEEMSGCEVVTCYNPTGRKEIYGCRYEAITVSYDNGATWTPIAWVGCDGISNADTFMWDMAYDHVNNYMYVVVGPGHTGQKFVRVNLNKQQGQAGRYIDLTGNLASGSFQLCAVDPSHTNVVYVGGYSGASTNPVGVQRSCDGGITFNVITTGAPNSIVNSGPAGGLSPYDIIVHPVTGEVWCAQDCNGWAKFPSPYED